MKTQALSALLVFSTLLVAACDRDKNNGTGLVADSGTTTTAAPTSTTPTPIDPSQCPGCQLAPDPGWTFEGIYQDSACTVPIAQTTVAACAAVPALGAVSVTFVDEVGRRKAGEAAQVTLADLPTIDGQRFRKAGTKCVRANEGGLAFTPAGCAGQRACRDANGGLVCTNCRTFANGCGDYEQTRYYAAITDPGLKAVAGGGGGGNVARLAACCKALQAEAARLGPAPEAGLLTTAAQQCLATVNSLGPNGNAPEVGAIKTMLAGRNVPAICSTF